MNKFLVAGIISAGLVLSGCNGGTPTQINPTYGGPQGQCMEADDEPCDDDPFDLDDLFESDHKKSTPTPKRVVPSPKPRVTTARRR